MAQLRVAEKAQVQEKTEALKAAHVEKLAEQRSAFLEAKAEQKAAHAQEAADNKAAWNKREAERNSFIESKVSSEPLRRELMDQHSKANMPSTIMDRMRAWEASQR